MATIQLLLLAISSILLVPPRLYLLLEKAVLKEDTSCTSTSAIKKVTGRS